MPRENIAMSPEEIVSFLKQMDWVAIGSVDTNGRIHAKAAPFVMHDRRLVFSVPSASQTAKNIEHGSHIVCSIDIFPEYSKIKGASVHGVPVRLLNSDIPDEVSVRLSERALAHELPSGETCFSLTLEDSFGFDFGKMKKRGT